MSAETNILIRISEQIGELNGKVDGILREQERQADVQEAIVTRIGVLEHARTQALMLVSMLGAAAGALMSLLIAVVKERLTS